MKILVAHNFYQQRGGEDSVVEGESRILLSNQHEVLNFFRHNNEIQDHSLVRKISLASGTLWAADTYSSLRRILQDEQPAIAHFHNTFPLISPAAYYACAEAGVPVVQTLHNYRLLCPGATLLREGRVCEDCVGRSVAWPGVVHGCYRGSRTATAAVAATSAVHRVMGTWREKVSVYVALTEFARRKFVEGGLPAERIVVKPNFVAHDPGVKMGTGEHALYVGRLSKEKGPQVLLRAWARLGGNVPLKLAGDGPLREGLGREIVAMALKEVELLGEVGPEEVVSLLQGARFLVLPSVCYENFPLAITEAFACGVPVIASRLGSMAEIVADGKTGLHFEPGNAGHLAAKVEWAWTHVEEMNEMGRSARREFEEKYTSEENYKRLMEIYELAMARPICETAELTAAR